jgi:alkaline phosphatase D
MQLNRREFLRSAATSGLTLPFAARAFAQPSASSSLFRHGVASGDPLADRVLLWTRVTPAAAARPVDVGWRVASDPAMARLVASGTIRTAADRDFTIKVDAGGLEPATTYYYRFDVGSARSTIGRTRTLPAASVPRVRLAVVSCSNYPYGFFNVYRCIARRGDLDAVVHLGDYIYEFENGRYGDGTPLNRVPDPRGEIVALDDYRRRYATYRTDPDLQEAHRQHPFVTVWDDHELANNAWLDGAENHNPEKEEGDWAARRAAAWRAYLEWMPVREQTDRSPRLYRSLQFGTLADLVMLDARALRDRQTTPDDLATIRDEKRTMLGAAQEAWLSDTLRDSMRAGTRWRVIGQQVVFTSLTPPGQRVRSADSWDGYQSARQRVFDTIDHHGVKDIVILTGDVHSSWALDVAPNAWEGYDSRTGERSVAVELTTPAISSPPIFSGADARERAAALKVALPNLKFMDGANRGYVLIDITPERMHADYYFVPTVAERSAAETHAAALLTERGSSHLVEAGKPASTQDHAPLAPAH